MIRLTLLARPRRTSDRLDGAYVVVWIACDDAALAERRAREWIAEDGWIVESVAESARADRRALSAAEQRYFDEAVADGGSLVYHQFPPSGE